MRYKNYYFYIHFFFLVTLAIRPSGFSPIQRERSLKARVKNTRPRKLQVIGLRHNAYCKLGPLYMFTIFQGLFRRYIFVNSSSHLIYPNPSSSKLIGINVDKDPAPTI